MNSPLMLGVKNPLTALLLRMNFLLLRYVFERIRRFERFEKNKP